MAIQGDLGEVSLATLMQLVLQEGGEAVIHIAQPEQAGLLQVANGRLNHASIQNQHQKLTEGEEAVYQLLTWESGQFNVSREVTTPLASNIQQSWDYLLMEGLRRLDEAQGPTETIEQLFNTQENDQMASKSEQLKSILNNLVNNSSDIVGAAVVDNDGLLLASVLPGNTDGNRVAAITAGLISLAGRSAQQLQQGNIKQTLIQADNGNIIAVRGNRASFVALTPTNVNLGMAFMECKDAADSIQNIL